MFEKEQLRERYQTSQLPLDFAEESRSLERGRLNVEKVKQRLIHSANLLMQYYGWNAVAKPEKNSQVIIFLKEIKYYLHCLAQPFVPDKTLTELKSFLYTLGEYIDAITPKFRGSYFPGTPLNEAKLAEIEHAHADTDLEQLILTQIDWISGCSLQNNYATNLKVIAGRFSANDYPPRPFGRYDYFVLKQLLWDLPRLEEKRKSEQFVVVRPRDYENGENNLVCIYLGYGQSYISGSYLVAKFKSNSGREMFLERAQSVSSLNTLVDLMFEQPEIARLYRAPDVPIYK